MKIEINGEKKDMRAVWFEIDKVCFIDQRRLPHEFMMFEATDYELVGFAIKDMVVRGAPAIGVTAGYGMALTALSGEDIHEAAAFLKASRPTAYDLFHAVDYMVHEIEHGADALNVAEAYADDIIERAKRIGGHGARLIKNGYKILTHCNAGALATVDWGTALAPIRVAHYQNRSPFVYVDETRPRLQGRLTSWELLNEGIAHKVIADNAAGHFMKAGEVDMVIVGADRVVRNGDFANKIGTYEKAVLARENNIPFYVAAPASTFDLTTEIGDGITIEERDEKEVLEVGGTRIMPRGASAYNPAFDVTPARYVTGYITEKGVLTKEGIGGIRE